MRFALVLTLFLVCLAAFGLSARHHAKQRAWVEQRQALGQTIDKSARRVKEGRKGAASADNQQTPVRVGNDSTAKTDKDTSWTETGMDKTSYADAEKDALTKIQGHLLVLLRDQNPPMEWTPDLDYIKAHLVTASRQGERDFRGEVGPMKTVIVEAELTPQARADLIRQEQHFHMQDRLSLALKVLGGIMALCLAAAGYIRLDEWTKGYSNALLRVAATGLVVVVVIVLLLIR
jgi:hypothetical protein